MDKDSIFPIDQWSFGRETILADLPEGDCRQLFARKTEHVYKEREIIFKEEGYPTGVYYIIKGIVKKYKIDQKGVEQIIYIAGPGELLGYSAVVSGTGYPDHAATLAESLIAFIPREDFLEELDHSKLFARRLLCSLSHEFSVLGNTLALYARRSVRERLALQLVIVLEKYKANTPPGQPVVIDLSREDLANLVGTARENVVRMLTELKEAGILETERRKISILDIKRLIAIANTQ